MARWLRGDLTPDGAPDCYPPHLEVWNLCCHNWRGQRQPGRFVRCLVCNVASNTRNRNGDARFIRAHRRCALRPPRRRLRLVTNPKKRPPGVEAWN